MPTANVQVTLAEALEVRGGPMQEAEIWSVLSEASRTLITLCGRGELSRDGQPCFIPSPDLLLLTSSGRVHFSVASMTALRNHDFIPPEYLPPPHRFSPEAVNKMLSFCLGMTVYWAADFKLGEKDELQISPHLDNVLGALCEEDASFRMSLQDTLEACNRHGPEHCNSLPFSHFVLRLHKLVLGSIGQLDIWSPDRDMDSRGLRKSLKEQRERSRSRSRSRSKDRRDRDRPHPLGRDQSAEIHDGHSTLLSNASGHSSSDRMASAQHTYARLVERRRKLEALRKGLDIEESHSERNSFYSEPTDFGESKSMISATSYTRGAFHPENWKHSTLQMGRDSTMTSSEGPLGDPSSWLLRQEQDIEAIRKAQEDFLAGAQSSSQRPAKKSNRLSPKSTLTKRKTPKKPTIEPKPKQRQPRNIYGPEFIQNDKIISLLLPEARAAPGNNHRMVIVSLLDGRKLNIECEITTTAKQLYDFVVSQLSIPEHFFFGLTFMHDDEYFFLEGDLKLSKVAPGNWKGSTPAVLMTYMRVKFYVDTLNAIRHDATRHLFYLQLRQDLLKERCLTNEEQAVRLAGLAMQAEYEDWTEKAARVQPEFYLPPSFLRRIGRETGAEKMAQKYRQCNGTEEKQAELLFIQEAQQLPEYGIHYYKVSKGKKDQGLPVWTGISVHGVLMADRHGNERVVYQRHPWHLTQKISFNKRRFSILPKSDAGGLKLPKFNYYTESYKKGRYLLQLCTAHHRFEMMMRTRRDNMEMTAQPQISLEESWREDEMNNVEEEVEMEEEEEEEEEVEEVVAPPQPTKRSRNRPRDQAYVIGESILTHNSTLANESISDSLAIRLAELPQDETSLAERRILSLVLPKEGPSGIGITIIGGDRINPLDLGCFVQSVIPNSPADRDGRIQPGDRLIAINGKSVEGMPHHKVVELIRDSARRVELLISQPLVPMEVPDMLSRESSPSPNRLDAEVIMVDPPRDTPQHPEIPSSANSSELDLEDMLPTNFDLSAEEASDGRRSSTPIQQAIDEGRQSVTGRWNGTSDGYLPDEDFSTPDGEVYEVKLRKINNSLGLNVAGGVNTSMGGIFVKSLADRGAAGQNGRILIGDRVLEVNGVSLVGVTHNQAVETLRSAPQVCKLVMQRQVSPPATSNHGNQKKTSKRSSLMSYYSFAHKDNTFEVKLRKEANGLGLSLMGEPAPNTKRCVLRVKEVFPGGAAAQTQNIEKGDVLLEVNGESLKDCSHHDALEMLRASSSDVLLLLCRPENPEDLQLLTDFSHAQEEESPSSRESASATSSSASTVIPASSARSLPPPSDLMTSSSFPDEDRSPVPEGWSNDRVSPVGEDSDTTGLSSGEYEINLAKGEKGLGFTLAGGQHTTGFFYVKEILYEPALSCSALNKGDRLLRVNGHDLTVLEHKEAIELLRTASGSVLLRLSLADDTTLPPSSSVENSETLDEEALDSFPDVPFVDSEIPSSSESPQSNVIQAQLFKMADSFGFSLIQGERGEQSALFVKTVTPGGSADLDGRLHVSDRLIQVNGESVIGMVHNKAVALIKASGDCLNLTLTRSPEKAIRPESNSDIDDILKRNLSFEDFDDEEKSDVEKRNEEDELKDHLLSLHISSPGNKAMPTKPPRSTSLPFNRLPANITEEWFESLPLLDAPPKDSILYSGHQLMSAIEQLQVSIDDEGPVDEFKKLKYAKLTDNCVAARRPENKNKNRYRNVLPYDANRVKLAGSDDYMNASHVRLNLAGGRAYLSYLACQGPLPNTTHDFWRMVWEQKAQVIAMVTQEVEASKVKCHRYWPDTSMVVCEGRLEISKVKQRSLANVGVSWLSMRDTATGETHPVMHLNYTTWPDHGAPLNALPLLRYIRLVHLSENTSDPAPIVVHCSAGIGRTGAFITIDAALKMVQHDSKVDIQKIVQDLRRQRQGMIQTKDQYVFCYQALLQALQSLLPSA